MAGRQSPHFQFDLASEVVCGDPGRDPGILECIELGTVVCSELLLLQSRFGGRQLDSLRFPCSCMIGVLCLLPPFHVHVFPWVFKRRSFLIHPFFVSTQTPDRPPHGAATRKIEVKENFDAGCDSGIKLRGLWAI